MGVADVVMGLIKRVRNGESSEDAIRKPGQDPFLARSLEIDEEIRTGRNRPLSPEEQRKFVANIRRGK